MSALNNIQKTFFADKKSVVAEYFISNHIAAADRINVYRNTIMENLRNALELTFPDTWKLLGKDCADSMAYLFIQKKQNLPITQCLDDWGDKFPEFLQKNLSLAHLIYLKDFATIEWYKHRSYCAANSTALSAEKLQKTLTEDLEKLQLILNPTVFLHPCNYNLQPIFELLSATNPTSSINLQPTPSFALIFRKNNHVQLEWLSYELFKLLYLLQKKNTLMQAYSTLLNEAPEFNLTQALQFILQNELLWKYHIKKD